MRGRGGGTVTVRARNCCEKLVDEFRGYFFCRLPIDCFYIAPSITVFCFAQCLAMPGGTLKLRLVFGQIAPKRFDNSQLFSSRQFPQLRDAHAKNVSFLLISNKNQAQSNEEPIPAWAKRSLRLF